MRVSGVVRWLADFALIAFSIAAFYVFVVVMFSLA
jgi:hypothetical protein